MNVSVPLDHFPVNTLTSKVFSFMVKKGKHFSGKVTPLFASMLVQPTEDEGATSERPSKPQPTPSPPHPSEVQVEPQSDPSPRPSPSTHIPDSILESSGGNHGDQAKEIKHLKVQIKKLKKKAKPVITHHRAWMKSVSLKQRLAGKKSLKKNWMQKESVSKQGRKSAKAEPSVHKNPLFDELPDDTLDYMDTEDAQDVGRTRDVVNEEKETADDKVSTEDALSTAQQKVSTDRPNVSTDRPKVNTDKEKDSTVSPDEGIDDCTKGRSSTPTTPTTTPTMFGYDETIAQIIKPLLKIDPKDKGKKKIEEEDESDTESEGILEAEKKFKQLASDEEMARKVQEEWEGEEERKRLAEENATNDALIRNYDDIMARIEADRLLAEKFQEEEREQFTIEEIAKFLHDTIHVGKTFKHSDLKTKKFEEIQALYEKIKRSDEDFISIRSAEDERLIKKMNEKGIDSSKNESVKEEGKEEEGTKKRKGGHIKMIARKKKRSKSDVDSDDEHKKCLKIVTFEATIDTNGNFRAFNYLMEILHIFDRQDLFYLYDLMREQYSEVTLDGFVLILWGDLKIMMESSTEGNELSDFWSGQQDWKIVTWRLYESCGVCILELEDGIVIHMLVERRYPLSKDLLQRMLDLGLEVERESSVALDLIRFIKQQIDEE
ncbi:hypothetical protein Tco_0435643 [Tanacetum coccineum]